MSGHYQTLAQSLDAYLKERAFNGVALVASEGEMVLLQPYGMANVKNQEAMSVDHQFHIASVSKSFVAVSILQLVEEGKLSLDQTIESYFPECLTPIKLRFINYSHIPRDFILAMI